MKIDFPKSVPASEFSETFAQGMANRMALSYFKYGAVAEAYPARVDAIKSLQQRIERYAETGNTEWLMDAANFAMIEFMHPRHPQAHFVGTDSHESPGRIGANGLSIGAASNTTGRDNVRLGGSNMTTAGGHYKREGD